ncbi:MAG: hypothetical protein WC942_06920 [Clostridia bacterium]|jgi:hypothetical protein
MSDSPAVILFDINGQPISIEKGQETIISQHLIPISGETVDGYAQTITLNPDGSLYSTQNTERFEKITIGTTDTIYMGTAPLGSDESDLVWKIKRVIIIDNFPTSIMISNSNISWNDRNITEYY